MISLKIYGKPTSTYAYMKNMVYLTAKKANIELHIEEIMDTQQFINHKIMSIPAYQLNGVVAQRGNKGIDEFMNDLRLALLKQANFGNMKTIYVPIDYSDVADNAISYAINISKHFNTVINLINTYLPSHGMTSDAFINPELRSAKKLKLTDFTRELNRNWIGDSNSPIINSELIIGSTIEALQSISEKHPNNWIVIGSSDSPNNLKNIFGSISIAIGQGSSCPVFIIPPSASFSPLKKVAFCSSDDVLDLQSVANLLDITQVFESEVHIIHVKSQDDYHEFNLLNFLNNNYPKCKIIFNSISGENQIDAVNTYCHKNDIQLLAMAKRKRGIIKELFHKSFTKQIAITATIPLLILHK